MGTKIQQISQIIISKFDVSQIYLQSVDNQQPGMNQQISIDDFSLLNVIGKGTYAKVILVKHKKTANIYAMKILKKKYIAEKKQELHIKTEREVLSKISHPFLVRMHYCFQDPKKLYFVLEYCPGGQLFGLLQIKNYLSEQQTKFYAAQIFLALELLHSKNILYRDLKPQNILIDKKGYIKLTDFGLSKILAESESAQSICGTPEYLAPEIVNRQGHQKPVDWWCFGCLIYEMMTGRPPFESQNRNQLFEMIRTKEPAIPKDFSPKLITLLKGLFIKNPKKRLGSAGAEQVKSHPWFQKVNWDSIYNKTIQAPFVPKIKNQTDISNFDVQFTSQAIESYQDAQSMNDQPKYLGFSFDERVKS